MKLRLDCQDCLHPYEEHRGDCDKCRQNYQRPCRRFALDTDDLRVALERLNAWIDLVSEKLGIEDNGEYHP